VYIPDDDIVGTASIQKGFPHQFVTEEYTRTDAFVKKACEFLKEHREEVRTEDNGIMGWIEDCFIENFKKYLEEQV
jgi:hypothetical protein